MEVRLARPHDKHAQYVDRNRLLGQTPNDRSGRAAQSDVVRLNVLANHGGVWADATVACMQPLDLWLDAALSAASMRLRVRASSPTATTFHESGASANGAMP